MHLRTPSSGAVLEVGTGGAGDAAIRGAGVANAPAAAQHRRTKSDGIVHTAAALKAASAEEGTSDLEFSANMAESMSLDALKELAAVLTRTIATRNKELISLQLRRDELRHEREYRQATVAALVAQVDRSQFVKEERRKANKR